MDLKNYLVLVSRMVAAKKFDHVVFRRAKANIRVDTFIQVSSDRWNKNFVISPIIPHIRRLHLG